jgi:hypothetical protein
MRIAHEGDNRSSPGHSGLRSPVARHRRPVLIGFTYPIPCPAKPNPLIAIQELNCAVGVVTARRSRSRGVSPRYAGRKGRLRACMTKAPATLPIATRFLVTTPILKPLLFPAFGRGGGGFAVDGELFVVEDDADVF